MPHCWKSRVTAHLFKILEISGSILCSSQKQSVLSNIGPLYCVMKTFFCYLAAAKLVISK